VGSDPLARRLRLRRGGLLGLALLGAGCGSSPAAVATPATSARPSASGADPLDLTMALGQTVGVAFSGREVTPGLRHLIVDDKVGTVVLLPSNFGDAAGLRHLAGQLAALGREAGLPARYVSGYLHFDPAAEPRHAVAGQSHAWIEFWTGEWVPCDPTNLAPVGERHVVVARGRDYADVPPLKGIYHGAPSVALDVTVEITRL